MTQTIRKPTRLDFTDERFAIGDRAAAVTKQNAFSDEIEEFSRQVNDEMIPDIEAVGNAAIAARDAAASSAAAAEQSAIDAANAASTAANEATTAAQAAIADDVAAAEASRIAAEAAAATAAADAAVDFNATVVADALADVDDIPTDGQLFKNNRYYLPAGSSATMPSDAADDDWIELIPAGNLANSPATVTFSHPVQDSSGQSLAAGTHSYNGTSIRKFVFNNGGWL